MNLYSNYFQRYHHWSIQYLATWYNISCSPMIHYIMFTYDTLYHVHLWYIIPCSPMIHYTMFTYACKVLKYKVFVLLVIVASTWRYMLWFLVVPPYRLVIWYRAIAQLVEGAIRGSWCHLVFGRISHLCLSSLPVNYKPPVLWHTGVFPSLNPLQPPVVPKSDQTVYAIF